MKNRSLFSSFLVVAGLLSCNSNADKSSEVATSDSANIQTSSNQSVTLPAPYATKSTTKFSKVLGWTGDQKPIAPEGFVVTKWAEGLDNPRWIYETPNGDILVAEANTVKDGFKKVKEALSGKARSQNNSESANHILIFRDADKDGKYEIKQTFLAGLNRPFGMLVLNKSFYVANTDGLWQYPYDAGQTQIQGEGKKIVELPAGGYNNHWTRNIIANKDGSKIYISVGSGSNVAEHGMANEIRRANILEINPDGSGERIYASGLRNPVGMSWAPGSNTLWTAVNERDELGDDLVPDYITSVKEGAFYGWPFAYFGPNEDPRRKGENPEMVKKTVVPDLSVGPHTASLGLVFYDKQAFPEKYRDGAFITQHGSWNRSSLSGYKVLFVPFKNGMPSGSPEDFLSGFISNEQKGEVFGRPVGIVVLKNGSILITDDAANTIWQVSARSNK